MVKEKLGAGKKFSETTRKNIRVKQDNCCAICKEKGKLEIHHIVPKFQGGTSDESNGLGVCKGACHTALNEFAFEKRRYYPEVVMIKDFWYRLCELQEELSEKKSVRSRGKKNKASKERIIFADWN